VEAEVSFPAELASAAAARRFAESTLTEWGCGDLLDTVRLLVSELVINAVLHARTSGRLAIRMDGGELRVAVHDSSPSPVRPRSYPTNAPTGRGLMILDAMAEQWGVEEVPGGKAVWFSLRLPALAGSERSA
jgi:anti-sigma regulatory factor (Ser/Thr protein kinase)